MKQNPYDGRVGDYKPEPHSFYADRESQGICKNCSEEILRDGWTKTGWAHYATAMSLCYTVTYAEPG